MNTQKIKLDYPIKINTTNGDNIIVAKKIDELEIRRIKVKDIRKIANITNEKEAELALTAELTGLMLEDLDNLDILDYQKLQAVVSKMLNEKKP